MVFEDVIGPVRGDEVLIDDLVRAVHNEFCKPYPGTGSHPFHSGECNTLRLLVDDQRHLLAGGK